MTITYEGATEQVRQIVHHHAVLRRGLERRAGTLCEAVESGVPFERQLAMLRDYLTGEILPHAEAEERTLYPAAATQARGSELVRALTGEHHDWHTSPGGSRPARTAPRPPPPRNGSRRCSPGTWPRRTTCCSPRSPAPARTWPPSSRTCTNRRRLQPGRAVTVIVPKGEIVMYPDLGAFAGQLAIMAVVVVVSLAAWLIAVFLAARQPRGTSAAVNAGPHEEETAATVTRLPSGARPPDKAAA